MLLTVRDAARKLNCSRGCVYRLAASGRLPQIRVGIGRGTIRIRDRDLAMFVEDQCQPDKPVGPPRIDLRQFAAPLSD